MPDPEEPQGFVGLSPEELDEAEARRQSLVASGANNWSAMAMAADEVRAKRQPPFLTDEQQLELERDCVRVKVLVNGLPAQALAGHREPLRQGLREIQTFTRKWLHESLL